MNLAWANVQKTASRDQSQTIALGPTQSTGGRHFMHRPDVTAGLEQNLCWDADKGWLLGKLIQTTADWAMRIMWWPASTTRC